ncbi:MAG: methyltransferase domain-containing protein, partial [Promethearchaeota archaeon]
MKILDFGCGRGLFVLWLKEHGYNAYGIDIDPIPIKNG